MCMGVCLITTILRDRDQSIICTAFVFHILSAKCHRVSRVWHRKKKVVWVNGNKELVALKETGNGNMNIISAFVTAFYRHEKSFCVR